MSQPKNTWYEIRALTGHPKAATSAEAEVYIYDEIGGWGVTANEFIADLKALGDLDVIHLRINSPGGSVIEGNVIYNALKRSGAKIVTHIDGMALSMASVIALAGHEVHMAANALFMIHNPWTATWGDAEALRKEADLLDKIKDTILNAYSRSGLARDELAALMDAETWFTAEEALGSGFVDAIEGENRAAALKALEQFPLDKFKAIPSEYLAQLSDTGEADDAADDAADILAKEHASALQQLTENAVEINDLHDAIERLTDKLAAYKAEIDSIRDTHKQDLAAIEAKHKAELQAARDDVDDKVAARAARMLAEAGIDPVDDAPGEPEAATAKTARERYDQIVKIHGVGHESRKFFREHRSELLRG